jgi:outer membrane protein assembly factor BamB
VVLNVGAGEDKTILALDRKTGRERWAALDDPASYSAPIVVERGGRRVLVCWTGSSLVGLDPPTGKVLWAHPYLHRRWIGMVATPVAAGGKIFVSTMDEGSLLVELSADGTSSRELWRRRGANEIATDALHTMISTPQFDGNYIYGVDSYGQLRCLDANSGDRLWESTAAVPKARWSNIHLVQNGQNTWLFNERGELIIARLSPAGYEERSRAKLIKPTLGQLNQRGGVCWSHPAFAGRCVFARNDEELIAVSLAAE